MPHTIVNNGVISTYTYFDETTGTSNAQFTNSSINGILDEFYGAMPATYGGYFDGLTNTYLSVPNTNIGALYGSDFTIECFIYLNGYGTFSSSSGLYRAAIITTGSVGVQFLIGLEGTANSYTGIILDTAGILGELPISFGFQLHTWYHIAVTAKFDGVNNYDWYFYVDGKLIGKLLNESSTWTDESTYSIGRNNGVGVRYNFNGIISNFRLIKDEIFYKSQFTPPNWPLSNTSNTKLLTCQSSTFIDNSSSPATITNNGATIYQHDKLTRVGKNGIIYSADSFRESPGTIVYTLGSGGVGGYDDGFAGVPGTPGTQSTLSYKGVILIANGGQGGSTDNASPTPGGTASGASANSTGGTGLNRVGNVGGGGGGGINGNNAVGLSISADGGNGAGANDFNNLSIALSRTGYRLGDSTLGANSNTSSIGTQNGASALITDIGNGGAGAGTFAGWGGNGGYGGGGGGSASWVTIIGRRGGNGGNGILVLQFNNSNTVILTSGTSFNIPGYATNVNAWLIGAGGGGGGPYDFNASGAGAGGGAGGIVYYSWEI